MNGNNSVIHPGNGMRPAPIQWQGPNLNHLMRASQHFVNGQIVNACSGIHKNGTWWTQAEPIAQPPKTMVWTMAPSANARQISLGASSSQSLSAKTIPLNVVSPLSMNGRGMPAADPIIAAINRRALPGGNPSPVYSFPSSALPTLPSSPQLGVRQEHFKSNAPFLPHTPLRTFSPPLKPSPLAPLAHLPHSFVPTPPFSNNIFVWNRTSNRAVALSGAQNKNDKAQPLLSATVQESLLTGSAALGRPSSLAASSAAENAKPLGVARTKPRVQTPSDTLSSNKLRPSQSQEKETKLKESAPLRRQSFSASSTSANAKPLGVARTKPRVQTPSDNLSSNTLKSSSEKNTEKKTKIRDDLPASSSNGETHKTQKKSASEVRQETKENEILSQLKRWASSTLSKAFSNILTPFKPMASRVFKQVFPNNSTTAPSLRPKEQINDALSNIKNAFHRLEDLKDNSKHSSDPYYKLKAFNTLYRDLKGVKKQLDALEHSKEFKLSTLHKSIQQVSSDISQSAIAEMFHLFRSQAAAQIPVSGRFVHFDYALKTSPQPGAHQYPQGKIEKRHDLTYFFQVLPLIHYDLNHPISDEKLQSLQRQIQLTIAPKTYYHEFQSGPYCQTTAVNNFLGEHIFSPEWAEDLLLLTSPQLVGGEAPPITPHNREVVHELLYQKIQNLSSELGLEFDFLEDALQVMRVETFSFIPPTASDTNFDASLKTLDSDVPKFIDALNDSSIDRLLFSFLPVGQTGHIVALRRSPTNKERWVWLDGNGVPMELNLKELWQNMNYRDTEIYIDLPRNQISEEFRQQFAKRKLHTNVDHQKNMALGGKKPSEKNLLEVRYRFLEHFFKKVQDQHEKATIQSHLTSQPTNQLDQPNNFYKLKAFYAAINVLNEKNQHAEQAIIQRAFERTQQTLSTPLKALNEEKLPSKEPIKKNFSAILESLKSGKNLCPLLSHILKTNQAWWNAQNEFFEKNSRFLNKMTFKDDWIEQLINEAQSMTEPPLQSKTYHLPISQERYSTIQTLIKRAIEFDEQTKILEGQKIVLMGSTPPVGSKEEIVYRQEVEKIAQMQKKVKNEESALMAEWQKNYSKEYVQLEQEICQNAQALKQQGEAKIEMLATTENISMLWTKFNELMEKTPPQHHALTMDALEMLSQFLVAHELLVRLEKNPSFQKKREFITSDALKDEFSQRLYQMFSDYSKRSEVTPIYDECIEIGQQIFNFNSKYILQ